MKRLMFVVLALGACGNSNEEKKEQGKELADKLGDRLRSAGDKVREQATTSSEKVADKAQDLTAKAKGLGGNVIDKTTGVAGDVAAKASALSKEALAARKQVKAELGKVYQSKFDYDITVDATPEAAADHEARLAKMPSVKVGTTAVGYEQDSEHSLLGVKYSRHFRATWRALDGRTVRLSFYTQEELDLPAFVKLLQKIVPVAMKVV